MQKQSNRAGFVLACGLIGILGALLTIISDLILLGKSGPAYYFFKLGTETMANISQWRITLGTFLGIIVLPLQIAGLMTVYNGLKPAGKRMPLVVAIAIAHTLVMGVAFHVSYAFIGSGWKLYYGIGQENLIVSEMMKKFDYYWGLIGLFILAELLFSSILYTYTILKKKTLYPKWMVFLNPICILLYMYPLINLLPAPIGGFVAPTYANLSTIVFLIFSTVTVFQRLKISQQ